MIVYGKNVSGHSYDFGFKGQGHICSTSVMACNANSSVYMTTKVSDHSYDLGFKGQGHICSTYVMACNANSDNKGFRSLL